MGRVPPSQEIPTIVEGSLAPAQTQTTNDGLRPTSKEKMSNRIRKAVTVVAVAAAAIIAVMAIQFLVTIILFACVLVGGGYLAIQALNGTTSISSKGSSPRR